MNLRKFGGLILFVGILARLSIAQVELDIGQETKPQLFFFNQAVFYTPDHTQIYLEIYYKIHNPYLTFIKEEDHYKSSYEVRVSLLGKKNIEVKSASLAEDYIVSTYAQTQNFKNFIVNLIPLQIPPGNYKLSLSILDKNTHQENNFEKKLKIPYVHSGEKFALSDFVISREIKPFLSGSKFNKDTLEIIPQVSTSVSEDESLLIYFEIYKYQSEPFSGNIIYEIKNELGRTALKETEIFSQNRFVNRKIKGFDVHRLTSGEYSLVIKISNISGKPQVKKEANFRIAWTPQFLVKADFKKAVDQLRHIATSEQIKKLKESRLTEQIQQWEEFWKAKDPTPSTKENELQEEYYRRIQYANENFSVYSKEGWKTDMGMIYIKYGKPDDVERHPYDRESPAHQIWYYYHLSPVRIFLFVDESGYGEYELQYPYDGLRTGEIRRPKRRR